MGQSIQDDTAKTLKELAQSAVDYVFIMEQATADISDPMLRDELFRMRTEHEQCLSDLSQLIQEYGEEMPPRGRDLKGILMQGYAAIRGFTGDQGSLKALHSNLEHLSKNYKSALKKPLPERVSSVLMPLDGLIQKQLNFTKNQIQ